MWSESVFGLKYIVANRSLRGLALLGFTKSTLLRAAAAVVPAMVLARTADSEIALATVMMQFGIGAVVGGAFISLWGGPKRQRMKAVLLAGLASSLLGTFVMGIGESVLAWAAGAFFSTFLAPLSNGAGTAIWQAKIPPQLQGRIFSTRIFVGSIGGAIAYPLAGVLEDHVFEPLMTGSSGLSLSLSRPWWVQAPVPGWG